MDKLNVGVIGVGWFGNFHSLIYKSLPGVNLIGVCDLDYDRAKEVANKVGTKAFKDINDLLSVNEINAVSICTKEQFHIKPFLAACSAKKNILIEKPLALTVEEIDQMISAAKDAGIKATVGHELRFNQRLLTAKEKIQNGEIGSLKYFFARRNMRITAPMHVGNSCGYHSLVYHGAVHDIELMDWLSESEIVEANGIYQAGVVESIGIPVSDTVLALLKFGNGVAAITEHCWIYPESHPSRVEALLEINGTKGKIVINFDMGGAICYSNDRVENFEYPHWPISEDILASDLKEEIESFVSCIINNRSFPVTLDDARKAVKGAQLIDQSISQF